MEYSYRIATINIANISNETKIDALRSFVRSADLDVVLLQEVKDVSLQIPGFSIVFNVDHQQRGTAIATKDLYKVENIERSLDSRIISVRISGVTFINIYAPSGAAQRGAREDFFNTSVAHYLQHATSQIIIGGDFNSVVATKDATGNANISPTCKRLMNAARLSDSWEVLHGNAVQFSYIRSNTASRLDRILISNSLKRGLRTSNFSVTSFSDHKAYIIRIVLPNLGTPPGRGIWRLQPHVLNDPEILEEFSRKWAYWARSRGNFRSWIDWWIRFAKPKVISFLKWRSSIIHREFRETIELYRSCLLDAYNNYYGNAEQLTNINRIKSQMLRHQRSFSDYFRRTNQTFISGESTTLFHVAEAYGKRAKTTINSLSTVNGEDVEDPNQISGIIQTYFRELYAVEEREPSESFNPSKAIPAGNPDNDNIMQPVTTDEIFAALKTSASRKSPGSDGLPKEFYQRTWRIIKDEFTHVMNDALQGHASRDFYDGIIVLIKKKGRDNTIHGYRPISLLNYDYKLLARIIKQRLHSLIPLVLSNNQKCSNGNKTIFEATSRILDEVCSLKHRRRSSLLVSFDFDHAFDRVSHQFLRETMTKMNFNPQLVELLSAIWNQSFSKILVNGRLTQQFKIERSVRQGDPLSMYLFVIYLQPLLDNIKRSFPNAVLNAYADDISMFMDNEVMVVAVTEIFQHFGATSGAILNRRKTAAIMIGNVNLTGATEWLNIENFINILGVVYGENVQQARKKNWENVLQGIKTRIWFQNPRKLNIIQKVILLNAYISSKLWYMASNIAITQTYINKIRTEYGKFIWYGQPLQRIAFASLILPKIRGGLNLHCVERKATALLTNRLMSLTDELPFLRSFLLDRNIPIPVVCNHITVAINQLATLPDHLQDALSSQGIYQHLIAQLPDPGFMSAQQRNWGTVYRNLHSSGLTSQERSIWYTIMHKKIKHKELLFLRNVIDDPNCDDCPGEPETVVHKIFRCQRVREIWRYQRRRIIVEAPCLNRYEPEDFIYPVLRQLNRNCKRSIMKQLAKYFCYIIETPENNIGLDNYVFYISIS